MVKEIRVLHCIFSPEIGGMETGLVNLINHPRSPVLRHAVCAYTPERGSPGSCFDRIQNPECRVFQLHRARGNDPQLVAQLLGVMRAYRPTVVHTRNWATYVEGAIAATLARAPALIHGEHGTPSPGLWRHKWAYRLLARRTQLVVTVSDALAEHYRTTYGYWAPTIRTIRNGVDMEKFSPTADRASAKAALGLAGLSPVVGSVGRLVPVKGYDILLRAAALLIRQRPDARFLLIGDGPEKTNLQSLARQLGVENHVQFAGEQADVVPFYQAMDLFVSSSHSEGISNVILEALACGVPVVGTEVGGTPEILRLAGAAGIRPLFRIHLSIAESRHGKRFASTSA